MSMRKMMRGGLMVALLSFGPAEAAPAITGRWLTEGGKALVEVAPCGAALCGRIVRVQVRTGGGPALDRNNPDPKLRARPIVGIPILTGFTDAGTVWKGRIYDPESGRSYRSEVTRAGAVLKVKGCLGPFCRTQDWRRAD